MWVDLTAPSPLWHLSSTLVYSLAAEAGVAPARLEWLDATDVSDRRALFPEAATSDGTLDGVLSIVDDGSGGSDATEAAARLAALNASFFAALAPPLQLARLSYVGAVAPGACRTAAPAEVCSLQLDVIMATLGVTAWQYTAIVDGSGAVVHPALTATSSRDDVQAYLHYAGGGAKAFACAPPCASPPSAPPDPPAPPAPPPSPAYPTSDCVGGGAVRRQSAVRSARVRVAAAVAAAAAARAAVAAVAARAAAHGVGRRAGDGGARRRVRRPRALRGDGVLRGLRRRPLLPARATAEGEGRRRARLARLQPGQGRV